MSYILDALKKSEQERQIGHVPDISQVQETFKQAPPRWPRWLLLALLVNAVILVVLAWRTWDAQMQNKVATAPSTLAVPAPVRAPVPVVAAPPPPAAVALPTPPAPPVMEPAQPLEPSAVANEPTYEIATEAPSMEAALAPVTTSAPRWVDLPLEERANLPAPRIDVHVFAQEPERRFVLINLRKYRVGDTLDDGPSLVAILNDGIVLSYAGREYRVDRP